MIATLLRPDSGQARVAGYDVVADAHRVRELVSLTGQFAALDKNLTARENLILMARLRGRDRGPARRVADELIERFEIGDFRDRLVKNLSGGERRRVDLAAGLIDVPRCSCSTSRPRGSTRAAARPCGRRSASWWATGSRCC